MTKVEKSSWIVASAFIAGTAAERKYEQPQRQLFPKTELLN